MTSSGCSAGVRVAGAALAGCVSDDALVRRVVVLPSEVARRERRGAGVSLVVSVRTVAPPAVVSRWVGAGASAARKLTGSTVGALTVRVTRRRAGLRGASVVLGVGVS